MTVEVWSIVSSMVSVILGFLAIGLSVYFYVQSKNTEKATSTSLAKIETEADALQRLNVKWMDRLTRYVTEERRSPSEDTVTQLIAILSQVPQTIAATLTQVSPGAGDDRLIRELYSTYIALYFYTACTNYWSQLYLPNASDFDEANQFHGLCRRIADMSSADFAHMAGILESCDQPRLGANLLAHMLSEARDFWRLQVRSTSQVFVARERAQSPTG